MISSKLNTTNNAHSPIKSAKFSNDVVPTIGAVTPGRFMIHASASCAMLHPFFPASSSTRFTIASALACDLLYCPMNRSTSPRFVCCVSGRVRRPRARGDQGMDPTPYCWWEVSAEEEVMKGEGKAL